MYDFEYVKAGSVADAVKALADAGDGGEAQPLSGGQTLLPTLRARLGRPAKLVDLSAIDEMRGIDVSADAIRIGGAATHGAVAANEDVKAKIPGLAYLASRIGCPAVRHRGTMGGSIANHDPAACWPAACLGLGATIHTSADSGAGDIAADDFFTGMFDTALAEGQIVTGATFPIPEASNYQKFAQPASRFPLVGVFVSKGKDGVRVAVTGASESGVHRWTAAEEALGRSFSADAVPEAPSPDGLIADLHGSPEYRAHLVRVMTRRAVSACA